MSVPPHGALVTGEAVTLELRLARLPSRALAATLDIAVEAIAFLVGLLIITSVVRRSSGALITAVLIGWGVIVFLAGPITIETVTRGSSLGKHAAGLRVVREDGSAIRFRHAMVRGLAFLFLDFALWFGCSPGIICSLLNPQARRLGDLMAGTLVTRERTVQLTPPGLFVPGNLVGWVQSVEMSRLPDQLAATAGEYLARYGEIDAAVREPLGRELASKTWSYVSPPPPMPLPPPAYLSALIAERQRRARARLAPGFGTNPPPRFR